jgi:hypothetical protein
MADTKAVQKFFKKLCNMENYLSNALMNATEEEINKVLEALNILDRLINNYKNS